MAGWWHRDVIGAGKLPLMLCFLAFVVTFAITRLITRLIRDQRGIFHNDVTADGTHIHHSVPGLILLIVGAFLAVADSASLTERSVAGVLVGIGVSLVLDEFALILHLQDVYWSGEGQLSVEVVSLTAGCLGLALVGFSPFGVPGLGGTELPDGSAGDLPAAASAVRGDTPGSTDLDLGASPLPRQADVSSAPPHDRLRPALGPGPHQVGGPSGRYADPGRLATEAGRRAIGALAALSYFAHSVVARLARCEKNGPMPCWVSRVSGVRPSRAAAPSARRMTRAAIAIMAVTILSHRSCRN